MQRFAQIESRDAGMVTPVVEQCLQQGIFGQPLCERCFGIIQCRDQRQALGVLQSEIAIDVMRKYRQCFNNGVIRVGVESGAGIGPRLLLNQTLGEPMDPSLAVVEADAMLEGLQNFGGDLTAACAMPLTLKLQEALQVIPGHESREDAGGIGIARQRSRCIHHTNKAPDVRSHDVEGDHVRIAHRPGG